MSAAAVQVDEVALVRLALFESGLIPHQGTMIDVGAHTGSSLAAFVRAGWTVWAFEPSTVMYDALVRKFGQWRNLSLIPVAVSDVSSDAVAFYVSDQSTGISSLHDFHPSHEFSEKVATRRLDALPVDDVDFLKIDVEGHDRNVFRSRGSLEPRVVVSEFEDNKTIALGYTAGEYADEMTEAGYSLWVSEWNPIVRYGTTHSWRRIYRYDGNPPDATAWGNFIGVHESVGVDATVIESALFATLERLTGTSTGIPRTGA